MKNVLVTILVAVAVAFSAYGLYNVCTGGCDCGCPVTPCVCAK